jgi:cytoskeletal protein RodZ
LKSISDATKIRLFYLEAIERGEFGKLPGKPYMRSYIRQYARAIDFDEAELLRALPPETETEEARVVESPPGFWGRCLELMTMAFTSRRANTKRL